MAPLPKVLHSTASRVLPGNAMTAALSLSGFFQAIDGGAQLANVEWLGQHPVYVQLSVGAPVFVRQEGGQNHDLSAKIIGPQSSHQFQAGETGHVIVSNDDVEWRPVRGHPAERFVPIQRSR